MQKANNDTNLPSERIYSKWFVSVPAEFVVIDIVVIANIIVGTANYKQEVGWGIGPEHAVLESVFISKTKERERTINVIDHLKLSGLFMFHT